MWSFYKIIPLSTGIMAILDFKENSYYAQNREHWSYLDPKLEFSLNIFVRFF